MVMHDSSLFEYMNHMSSNVHVQCITAHFRESEVPHEKNLNFHKFMGTKLEEVIRAPIFKCV